MRARGMGANVVVSRNQSDSRHRGGDGWNACDAMEEAAPLGDIFITVTGNRHVIDGHHFARMHDGALVANSGHFDVELNLVALRRFERRERATAAVR